MEALSFIGDLLEFVQPVRDLIRLRVKGDPAVPGSEGITQNGGVYILMSSCPIITFRYPRDASRVYYIGQARNLRKRLGNRKKRTLELMANPHSAQVYRAPTEYGAAHGVHFTWIEATPSLSPKQLEDRLLKKFARRYRSIPVANGAAGWGRCGGINHFDLDE